MGASHVFLRRIFVEITDLHDFYSRKKHELIIMINEE